MSWYLTIVIIEHFLEVNSKVGQLAHGHEYAVYYLLTVLKVKKFTSKCSMCKDNQWCLSIKKSRDQRPQV